MNNTRYLAEYKPTSVVATFVKNTIKVVRRTWAGR